MYRRAADAVLAENSMSRRSFLGAAGAGVAGCGAICRAAESRAGGAQTAKRPPNIVLILTDDQGWGDLSMNGNTNLATPHIDALAAKGAVLEYFYVQPLCAPTRAELLTGRYYPRTGVRGVTRRAECLNLDEVTLGDVFREAGYATGCFGKWHSGSAYPYHPNGRGFDEFYGFCCGHWSHYFDSTLEHNGMEVKAEGYIVDALTDKALEFIKENADRPFLCYVPYNTPHSPFQVPEKWYEKFSEGGLRLRHRDPEKEELDKTRCVLGMCENIDWNVGRLTDGIEALGLTENTIFIYLSDNGPNTWRWNGGLRGKKGWTDEGGVRSPCIITWPGEIPGASRLDTIGGAIDLLPTLAGLCGVAPPQNRDLDGVNLAPLLTGQAASPPDRAIYALSANRRKTSIRTRQYRAGGEAKGLFDMTKDIGQHNDLSEELPVKYRALMGAIDRWRADVLPDGEPEDRPLPVGYREFPKTYLNAQDGLPEGTITWSSIHPNASFFIGWHNREDFIRWEIDVQHTGVYEVTVMYTCREGDAGAVLEAAFKDETVRGEITEAFNPPLKDDRDRVRRNESYEKAFHPLRLGTLRLEKGRGDFFLRALSKPGEEVCDVRAVRVELKEAE
jgi:arylsulfatase A-like enzyme